MKIKMYLFPDYVTLASAGRHSPRFFAWLREKGVEVEAAGWEGTIASLPTGQPAIIRGSSRMDCPWSALATACETLGHFVFYDDMLVCEGEDSLKRDGFIEAAEAFLAQFKSE